MAAALDPQLSCLFSCLLPALGCLSAHVSLLSFARIVSRLDTSRPPMLHAYRCVTCVHAVRSQWIQLSIVDPL